VRAFGSEVAQVKAMRERPDNKMGFLTRRQSWGTQMNDVSGLAATSLLASPEKNKIMITLSDGEAGDSEQTARTLQDARKKGIVTFGIYLGKDYKPEVMDTLYGKGNWAAINSLGEMPKAVAQRMASIFKRMH
jgi:hypothetical protein